jgi:5-methylcytosine-specific restriction endonuclease McrA
MVNLNSETVLVLNRNWQAIHVKSAADALSMMYTDNATGLDIQGYDNMVPYKWSDWVNLPHSDDAKYISTIRGQIKIPKVIVLCNYDKVPNKRPKFSARGVWLRDNGTCQYTGQKLTPNEANIDHVHPRSRGGKTNWSNCVLTHKKINAKKADMTPEEAGLRLIRQPSEPRSLPSTFYIKNKYNFPEWEYFLKLS